MNADAVGEELNGSKYGRAIEVARKEGHFVAAELLESYERNPNEDIELDSARIDVGASSSDFDINDPGTWACYFSELYSTCNL